MFSYQRIPHITYLSEDKERYEILYQGVKQTLPKIALLGWFETGSWTETQTLVPGRVYEADIHTRKSLKPEFLK